MTRANAMLSNTLFALALALTWIGCGALYAAVIWFSLAQGALLTAALFAAAAVYHVGMDIRTRGGYTRGLMSS